MRKNLLTGALVLGLAVVSPLVVGGTANALTISENYTLNNNLNDCITVDAGKNVVLDLNGHTITCSGADAIYVPINSTLTINDSSAGKTGKVDAGDAPGKAAIFNEGTVIVNGGYFVKSDGASDNKGFYNTVNHGTMTINGGKFEQTNARTNGNASSLIEVGYQDYASTDTRKGYKAGVNSPNPVLTINGGEFYGGASNVKSDDAGKVVINDGDFNNGWYQLLQVWNEMEINDGNFTQTATLNGGSNFIVRIDSNGTNNGAGKLSVNGGSFTAQVFAFQSGTTDDLINPIEFNGGNFDMSLSMLFVGNVAEAGTGVMSQPVVTGGKYLNNANKMFYGSTKVVADYIDTDNMEVIIGENGEKIVVRKVTEPVATNEAAPATVAEKAANTGAVSIISALAGALTVAALAMIGAVAVRKQIR